MKKKNLIKIPKNTKVLYDNKKNIIVLIGHLNTRSIKTQLKINVLNKLNLIEVTSSPIIKTSTSQQKKLKALKGTTIALIKQLLIETSSTIYKKLKFIGVGYRAFDVEAFETKLLMFKLGYSHSLYFKVPKTIKFFCLKFTKLFIYGNSYQNVTQIAALIRSYKKPEPYKGKGILYESEKIILKEGKKV
jgi:large subunit ribosomal protein L6